MRSQIQKLILYLKTGFKQIFKDFRHTKLYLSVKDN